MRRLCVSIPMGEEGLLAHELSDWLAAAGSLFRTQGWQFQRLPWADKPTASTRNYQCGEFLRSAMDLHLMVDSDAKPDLDGLLLLLDAIERPEVDVVSGWSLIRREGKGGGQLFPNVVGPPGEGNVWPVDFALPHATPGLHEITGGAVGAHCLLMTREVAQRFHDKELLWFEDEFYTSQDEAPPGKWGARKTGHDFMFCLRAAELGFRLWVDNRVLWGHFKTVDLAEWYRQNFTLATRLNAQLRLVEGLKGMCSQSYSLGGLEDLPGAFLMRYAIEAQAIPPGARVSWPGRGPTPFLSPPGGPSVTAGVGDEDVGLLVIEGPVLVPEDQKGEVDLSPYNRSPAGSTLLILGADTTEENRKIIAAWSDGRELISVETVDLPGGSCFGVVACR